MITHLQGRCNLFKSFSTHWQILEWFYRFLIKPDKGLSIFTFDNQANLQKHIPVLKEFFKDYDVRFSCKANIETGIVNEELDYKVKKNS